MRVSKTLIFFWLKQNLIFKTSWHSSFHSNFPKFSESARPKGNFRRRGNNPRGSYDVPPYAQQPPPAHPANNSENFRKFRDQSGRQKHQRPQNYNKNQPQNSSKTSGDNDAAASFPVTLEDEFEVGSVFNHGSKKHNINHLLNFQFEPRGTKQHQSSNIPGKTSSGRKNKKFFEEPAKPKYNKEQYLQANCQFVVKDSGDYTVHLADPDVLVDWDLVEQVYFLIYGISMVDTHASALSWVTLDADIEQLSRTLFFTWFEIPALFAAAM